MAGFGISPPPTDDAGRAPAYPASAPAVRTTACQAEFTAACESFHDAIVEQQLTHCGSTRFRQHAHNARMASNRWGVTVRKEHRESARKIDAVPAAVLARLARQQYLALPKARRRRQRTGRASFL